MNAERLLVSCFETRLGVSHLQGQVVQSLIRILNLVYDFSARFFQVVYNVCPSVLRLNNLTLHKT